MFSTIPGPLEQIHKVLGLLAALVFTLALVVLLPGPTRPILSRWAGPPIVAAAVPQPIAATAVPRAVSVANQSQGAVAALDRYNEGSALQDPDSDQHVRFYRRDVAGGSIAYFVVMLDQQVHLEVINADG